MTTMHSEARSTTPQLLSSPAGQIAAIAMGAAFIAALALIPGIRITPTVPFTLQGLAITLVAFLFNARTAGLAVGLYVLLGALGLPIFSGAKSGAAVLAGPTGGYLFGYIVAAVVMGFLASRSHPAIRAGQRGRAILMMLVAGVIGVVIVHIGGVAGMMASLHLPLSKALGITAVFIPLDIVKAAIAAAIAVSVLGAFRRQLLAPEAR